MPVLRTISIVAATATLTSAFWITLYNGAADEADLPPPQPPRVDAVQPAESVQQAQAASVAAVVPPGRDVMSSAGSGERPDLVIASSGLAIPVAGLRPRDLVDTYTASRSGGRVHNAIDIMAPRGTPVIAAAAGTVEKLHQSRLGGITAYVRTDDGVWCHYYAHLDSYAPGLREGQRLEQGDPIGFVGFSGNANPAGPHLHFGVYRMAPGQRWWQGSAVNPYPMLVGRR